MFLNRFSHFVTLIANSKYLKIYSRDQKFIDVFDSILFVNLIISLTIFVLIIKKQLTPSPEIDFNLFIKLMFGIGIILVIKVLVERLLGSLFEMDALIDTYLFQKTSYKNYLGLVLIPINIILIYAVSPSKILIYIIISLLLLINLNGVITSFKNHQKLIINQFFYFILYLCALEISPYIILYKLIIKQ